MTVRGIDNFDLVAFLDVNYPEYGVEMAKERLEADILRCAYEFDDLTVTDENGNETDLDTESEDSPVCVSPFWMWNVLARNARKEVEEMSETDRKNSVFVNLQERRQKSRKQM